MAYTDIEVAAIQAVVDEHGSVSFEQAVELARELCKTPRSVISKVKQLGLPYVPKEVEPAKDRGPTKDQLVKTIAEHLNVEADALKGLAKATADSLKTLVAAT